MGNYLFNNDMLVPALISDAKNNSEALTTSDANLIRILSRTNRSMPTIFAETACRCRSKEKKLVTGAISERLKPYYEANMDLCSVDPSFNLYNRSWPLRTVGYCDPPAKFVFDWYDRKGMAVNSDCFRRHHYQRQCSAQLRGWQKCQDAQLQPNRRFSCYGLGRDRARL